MSQRASSGDFCFLGCLCGSESNGSNLDAHDESVAFGVAWPLRDDGPIFVRTVLGFIELTGDFYSWTPFCSATNFNFESSRILYFTQ